MALPVLGWREWAVLPELGLPRIAAKLDTGARSSSLHVEHLECVDEGGTQLARFVLRDEAGSRIDACAVVIDHRRVTSSNGQSQRRVFIRTPLQLGGISFPIELNLTQRHGLSHAMLIGRSALAGRFLVDPQHVWLAGDAPLPHPDTSP